MYEYVFVILAVAILPDLTDCKLVVYDLVKAILTGEEVRIKHCELVV